jgi:hypothetical protein
MCISINIRRTNVAFFLCLRLCTSKVPLLVLMLISSCEPGLNCCSPAVLPLLLLSIVDVAATEYVAFVVYSGSPKVEAELLFFPVIYLHSSLSETVQ